MGCFVKNHPLLRVDWCIILNINESENTDYSGDSQFVEPPPPSLPTGVELHLRMAGDSRVHMDHDMEIGVTPTAVRTCFPYTHTFLSLPQLSCVTLLGGRERARKRERKRGWWKMEVSGVREKYKGTRGNHCGSWVSYKKGDHVCVPVCLCRRGWMDGSAHYHGEDCEKTTHTSW